MSLFIVGGGTRWPLRVPSNSNHSIQGQLGWSPGQPGVVRDMEVGGPACARGGWSLMILEVPSNQSHSVTLWFYDEVNCSENQCFS